MLKADNDQVILEIHRPGSWQQLFFPDSASREPFRDAIDPLLKCLDAVNKRKVPELSEEVGRNNCLPSNKLEVSQRRADPPEQPVTSPLPAANVPPARQETYALQMFDNRVVNYRTEAACLLVSLSGAYHLVKQSKSYDKGLTSAVLDGALTPIGLASLRAVLDTPDLMNPPEENLGHEVILTSDSYFTRLAIPRGEKVQKLRHGSPIESSTTLCRAQSKTMERSFWLRCGNGSKPTSTRRAPSRPQIPQIHAASRADSACLFPQPFPSCPPSRPSI